MLLQYAQIYKLRILLRRDTVQLGASAIVLKEIEEYVLTNCGFRKVSDRPFYTKIIRSSIDRLDITYVLKKISKAQLGNFNLLFFIIYGATIQFTSFQAIKDAKGNNVPKNGKAILEKIKKTIIFIDSRKQVQSFVEQVRAQLVQSTKDNPNISKRYTYGLGGVDVRERVQMYTSQVAKYD